MFSRKLESCIKGVVCFAPCLEVDFYVVNLTPGSICKLFEKIRHSG